MTTKNFYEDPDLNEFEATIQNVGENYILLNRTYFYPEGGGQNGDRGSIATEKVINTQEVGNEIRHLLESPPHIKIGQKVKCKLDWPLRLRSMKLHSLAHIIYLAFTEVAGKAKVIGSSVNPDKCRISCLLW